MFSGYFVVSFVTEFLCLLIVLLGGKSFVMKLFELFTKD